MQQVGAAQYACKACSCLLAGAANIVPSTVGPGQGIQLWRQWHRPLGTGSSEPAQHASQQGGAQAAECVEPMSWMRGIIGVGMGQLQCPRWGH